VGNSLRRYLIENWIGPSGGEQQRAHFARVLVQLACGEAAHGPGLLLLDEPTSSLDLRHQIDLVETARLMAPQSSPSLHDLNLAVRFAVEVRVQRHADGTPLLLPQLMTAIASRAS